MRGSRKRGTFEGLQLREDPSWWERLRLSFRPTQEHWTVDRERKLSVVMLYKTLGSSLFIMDQQVVQWDGASEVPAREPHRIPGLSE